ncbi:MAG: hypothetical protein U5K00_16010 [Melioribacteraceae bacterium]|nr:hypothetical protein [Melioribacteraceae bacterium]
MIPTNELAGIFKNNTSADKDFTTEIEITGLLPETKYNYKNYY